MESAAQSNMNIHCFTHQEHPNTMEDRTLALLQGSKIDQEIEEVKVKKKGGRKHKAQWMKRPMALSDVILELQEEEFRENALRCLSNHLNERREQDPENYNKAGFFVFHSFGTMAILLQEIMRAYEKMRTGNLNVRGSKRLANVLTLFQSIAANKETRGYFVKTCIPNYLVPFILSETTEEFFENVRAISLSVIGIVVQAREGEVILWALKNNIVEACLYAIEIGSELSKVIAMHIMESIFQDNRGISYVCETKSSVLKNLMNLFQHVVLLLASEQDFSPRLLFHVIRCYILLCKHPRALDLIKENLPSALLNSTFDEITKEFPMINQLLQQLLLNVGKVEEVEACVDKKKQLQNNTAVGKGVGHNPAHCNSKTSLPTDGLTPLHPIDLNKEYYSFSASHGLSPGSHGKEN